MKPPAGTTVIATPLANCWLDSQLICVDNVNCDRSAGNVTIHYKILQGIVGKRKACWLKSYPTCEEFNAAVNRMAAVTLPEMCQAMAIVTTSEATMALTRSYRALNKTGVPVEVFENEEDARKWLTMRCHL